MNILEAVNKRINDLLKERKKSWYWLEKTSGLNNGTILGVQYCRNKSIDLKTLLEITSTLNISLENFFKSEYFDDDNLELP